MSERLFTGKRGPSPVEGVCPIGSLPFMKLILLLTKQGETRELKKNRMIPPMVVTLDVTSKDRQKLVYVSLLFIICRPTGAPAKHCNKLGSGQCSHYHLLGDAPGMKTSSTLGSNPQLKGQHYRRKRHRCRGHLPAERFYDNNEVASWPQLILMI